MPFSGILVKLSAETLHDNDEVARLTLKLLQDPVSSGAKRFADVHRGMEIVLSRLKVQYLGFIISQAGENYSELYLLENFTGR